jgi:hypothetical protein
VGAAAELERTPGEEPRSTDLTLAPSPQPFKVAVFTTSYPRHADDFAGRRIGSRVGKQAWALAERYFAGTAR